MPDAVPPFLIYLIGALIVPFLKGRARQAVALAVPLLGIGNYFLIKEGLFLQTQLLDFQLTVMRVDEWGLIFLNIFTLLSLAGIIYIIRDNDPLELSAGLLYAGAAMGAVLSGDLISMFFFWEMLTVGAVLCILARRTDRSAAAAYRYLLVHVLGGVILLAGLLIHVAEGGSIAFDKIELEGLGPILMFIGFGINCAWPVLGAWLTDTYPEASVGGLIFMATYTTKTAIYVLARTFPGEEALLWIGVVMAVLPLFYALISNDVRRILAYCLINQVGFMVIGIGLGTALSLNGTAAHAYCHILYKALLFMAVGSVIYRTGKSRITDLGGLCRSMPWTCFFCCLGAASISAPLFSGFVSKSMIISSSAKEGYPLVWLALMFGSAGVFLVAGLKVVVMTFFHRDSGLRPKDAPWNHRIAMGIIAFFCVFVGSFPNAFLYPMLPNAEATYEPYIVAHVTDQLTLLFFCGLAFMLLLRSGFMPNEVRATNLDADWFYRVGGRATFRAMDKGLNGFNAFMAHTLLEGSVGSLRRFFENAPLQIMRPIMTLIWKIQGQDDEEIQKSRQDLILDLRKSALPIGLTACFSVILLALLLVL